MPLPSLLDEIDRLFEELGRRWGAGGRALVPAELRAVEGGWTIELPVQGLRARDVRIEVHGRELLVSSYRQREGAEAVGGAGWVQTRHAAAMHRRITLPGDADPEGVEATVEGETLIIHVPRRRS